MKPTMATRLVRGVTGSFERYVPDPLVLVLLLTLTMFALAMGTTEHSLLNLVQFWGAGLWDLVAFAMQMMLVLVLGYLLADAPPVRKVLLAIALRVQTPAQAVLITTFASLLGSYGNWGFGLVMSAFLAKAIARHVAVDYRVLIASAYSGFVIWHGGLSGSIPLTIATPGHFTEALIGVVPVSASLFSLFNLSLVLLVSLSLLLLNCWLQRQLQPAQPFQPPVEPEVHSAPATTPAERLEQQPYLLWLAGGLGLLYLANYFVQGGSMTLNIMNGVLLMLALLFHGKPRSLLTSLQQAMPASGAILLQFPFYAGLMALMVKSGLASELAQWFVNISNANTLPLWSFFSAGLLNLVIPSGGGQWAVQGPIMLQAAASLGADPIKVALAVSWGDAWTNLIQPFWALPILAIAGLRARDIFGLCLLQLLVTGAVIATLFALL